MGVDLSSMDEGKLASAVVIQACERGRRGRKESRQLLQVKRKFDALDQVQMYINHEDSGSKTEALFDFRYGNLPREVRHDGHCYRTRRNAAPSPQL